MERFTSAALREVLEKVAPAIAAGGASVISVEAIRDRSSDRWPRKREQVAAFVERAFGRLSQPGDFVVALNDAEFLTVQPSVTRTTALSISANILKETLAFFLGAAARDDLRLFQVTAFTNGELTVQPVDAGLILDGEDAGLVPERAGGEPGAEAAASKAALAPFLDDLAWVGPLKVRLTSPPNRIWLRNVERVHICVAVAGCRKFFALFRSDSNDSLVIGLNNSTRSLAASISAAK